MATSNHFQYVGRADSDHPTVRKSCQSNPPPPQAQSPDAFSYPVAERVAQVDQYHGTTVTDPYRWLEDLDSTNGTFLSGYRIGSAYLEQAAPLRIGATSLSFVCSNDEVSEPLSSEMSFGGILGRSVAMRHLFATLVGLVSFL